MTAQPSQDATLAWRKSSVSMGAGECVEVATFSTYVLARDSQDQSGTVLTFTSAQWHSLVSRIKNDRPGRG
jgi:Domain of unknown function (DUF397)